VRALYSLSGNVPLTRVLREHRAAVVPLVIVLALNVIALVAVVLPLTQRAAATEQRALAAERSRAAAEADFERAEALRASKSRATEDLGTFYRDVLPANVGAARRVLQLKLRQQADQHGVEYQGSGTSEEELRDSTLLRLTMSLRLAGSYEDIRDFIYELETSPDFVVIDQVRLSEALRAESGLELSLDVSTYYRDPRRSGEAARQTTTSATPPPSAGAAQARAQLTPADER
jgi:Tfp pilus assembly protein PilO